jgi:hypothetical protein
MGGVPVLFLPFLRWGGGEAFLSYILFHPSWRYLLFWRSISVSLRKTYVWARMWL